MSTIRNTEQVFGLILRRQYLTSTWQIRKCSDQREPKASHHPTRYLEHFHATGHLKLTRKDDASRNRGNFGKRPKKILGCQRKKSREDCAEEMRYLY